jgi:uncharacterized membrane protein
MEAILKTLAGYTSLAVEAVAVLLIVFGAIETVARTLGHLLRRTTPSGWRTELFVQFGVWLLLGLQFALAADIVRTVIAPTWNDIGQLAAIAAIRTFLNYFLERDIETASRGPSAVAGS